MPCSEALGQSYRHQGIRNRVIAQEKTPNGFAALYQAPGEILSGDAGVNPGFKFKSVHGPPCRGTHVLGKETKHCFAVRQTLGFRALQVASLPPLEFGPQAPDLQSTQAN